MTFLLSHLNLSKRFIFRLALAIWWRNLVSHSPFLSHIGLGFCFQDISILSRSQASFCTHLLRTNFTEERELDSSKLSISNSFNKLTLLESKDPSSWPFHTFNLAFGIWSFLWIMKLAFPWNSFHHLSLKLLWRSELLSYLDKVLSLLCCSHPSWALDALFWNSNPFIS